MLWIALALLAILTSMLLFPSPYARLFAQERLVPPIKLPDGVALRFFPRWLEWLLIGRAAMTLGTTILVRKAIWKAVSTQAFIDMLKHELVHVEQSRRYGVLYVPRYLVLFLLYGYKRHPMEQEARTRKEEM